MREGLKLMLQNTAGIDVVGDSENGHELLKVLRDHHVDVAVLDMLMPGMPGVELITRVKSEFPRVAVLVLTMHSDQQYAIRAFRAGASGYLTKDSAGTELTTAIRNVSQGKSHVTAHLADQFARSLNDLMEAPAHSKLSDREYEVFHLIVQGLRPTDIAEKLHVSVKTVSTHKARILDKMQLPGVAALIKYGLENKVFNGLEAESQD
jgi:DNA-binding NarL/FixJ family response regulator